MRIFGYARLTPEMDAALLEEVRGKRVVDLGCGDGELAAYMAQNASHVTAVDADTSHAETNLATIAERDRVTIVTSTFSDFLVEDGEYDLGVFSWPLNFGLVGIGQVLEKIPRLLVISLNDRHVACGTAKLWLNCFKRPVLSDYAPEGINSLTVYGEMRSSLRCPSSHEENLALEAATHRDGRVNTILRQMATADRTVWTDTSEYEKAFYTGIRHLSGFASRKNERGAATLAA